MKYFLGAAVAATFALGAGQALANCDSGEIVIKFSHVVAASGHPKGMSRSQEAAPSGTCPGGYE